MTPKDTKSLIETQDGAGARAAVGNGGLVGPPIVSSRKFLYVFGHLPMPNVAIIGGHHRAYGRLPLRKRELACRSTTRRNAGGVIRTTGQADSRRTRAQFDHAHIPLIMELVRTWAWKTGSVRPARSRRTDSSWGKAAPASASPATFLTTPLFLHPREARLLLEPFIRRSRPTPTSRSAISSGGGSGEFLEYAINPFVAGVYAGDPERLSVRHSFPKLHALEQLRLAHPRPGLRAKERKRGPRKGKTRRE